MSGALAFELMLNTNDFESKLGAFMASIYGTDPIPDPDLVDDVLIAPSGYYVTMLNVFDRHVAVPTIPASMYVLVRAN
jgi:hypothetical protein